MNVYLYRVEPNPAWRNQDLPTRDAAGRVVDRPLTAIDLYYLLTFYGDEATLEPQRLAGSVMSALHARPLITRRVIEDVRLAAADADPGDPRFYLADTDLDEQPESVRITPCGLDLEELSKLWSVFFNTPLALSVAYMASAILIEADETPSPSLPVRERTVRAVPAGRPVVVRALAAAGAEAPIVAGSALLLEGSGLGIDGLVARFGAVEARAHLPERDTPHRGPAARPARRHGDGPGAAPDRPRRAARRPTRESPPTSSRSRFAPRSGRRTAASRSRSRTPRPRRTARSPRTSRSASGRCSGPASASRCC